MRFVMKKGDRRFSIQAIISWLILLLLFSGSLSAARPGTLDVVNLQLRWHHQFQFAGYYAALEKGYYHEAGLDVRIHAGAPGRTPLGEVLSGRAEYGEANSELLYERLNGAPLVALAAIFQHSPSALLTRADSGIRSPHDLTDRKIMLIGDVTDADLLAMLHNEGVDLKRVQQQPSSYDIQDLIDGKTDAFNAYLTNEPYFLKQRGIDYNLIEPRRYGIDFYSDVLFTTEQELRDHPDRVHAFREASLRGWHYAMEHPEEIIELLRNKYGVKKTLDHLQYEAASMRDLIQPTFVDIGHMNPGRWQHMADTLVKLGMLAPGYSLEGFVYDTDRTAEVRELKRITILSLAITVLLSLVVAVFLILYHRLQKEIHRRQAAEQEIRRIAFHDNLTGLPNRHLFYDRFRQMIARSERDDSGFALFFLDLDGFKQINDEYGHATGDKLLREIAQRLASTLRASDTVARIGGDEFVALLADVDDRNTAQRLGETLLNSIRLPHEHEGKLLSVSASIGISLYPSDEKDIETLLHCADQAMYKGKQEGRNRLVFCGDAASQ